MTQVRASVDPDIAGEVVAFLQAHPSFLNDNPDLYGVLAPPARHYGDGVTDLMAVMIKAERAKTSELTARADSVILAGRAAAGLAGRVQEAVLALMRAADPIECVHAELADMLDVDAASFCLEYAEPGVRELPQGLVDKLMNGRDVVVRQVPTYTKLLHGEAAPLARMDALIRVRVDGIDGILALAARDNRVLARESRIGALGFLGQALSAALERNSF